MFEIIAETSSSKFMTKEKFDEEVKKYQESGYRDIKTFNGLRKELLPYLRWLTKKHVTKTWPDKLDERGRIFPDFLDDFKALQTEAEIGFWDAVRRYDPDKPDARRGHIPYLSKTIKNKLLALSNKLRRKNNMDIPKGGRILWKQINDYMSEFLKKYNKKPTDSQIIKRFRITRFDLETLMSAHDVVSMQDLLDDGSGSKSVQRGEYVSEKDLDSVYRKLTRGDKKLEKAINDALSKLTSQQMIAIRERFRLPGFKMLMHGNTQPTYKEIREYYTAIMPNNNKGVERVIKRGLKTLSKDQTLLKELKAYDNHRILIAIGSLQFSHDTYVGNVSRQTSRKFSVSDNTVRVSKRGLICSCGSLNCDHTTQVEAYAK